MKPEPAPRPIPSWIALVEREPSLLPSLWVLVNENQFMYHFRASGVSLSGVLDPTTEYPVSNELFEPMLRERAHAFLFAEMINPEFDFERPRDEQLREFVGAILDARDAEAKP